jgi:hypothetical protein
MIAGTTLTTTLDDRDLGKNRPTTGKSFLLRDVVKSILVQVASKRTLAFFDYSRNFQKYKTELPPRPYDEMHRGK